MANFTIHQKVNSQLISATAIDIINYYQGILTEFYEIYLSRTNCYLWKSRQQPFCLMNKIAE